MSESEGPYLNMSGVSGLTPVIRESVFKEDERFARVRAHFEQAFAGDVSLASAASIAGVERRYFSALFHAKTGQCFKDWIRRIRVRRALPLIRDRNLLLADVAARVGYDDVRSFQRAFKRETGMTAREFRDAARRVRAPFAQA